MGTIIWRTLLPLVEVLPVVNGPPLSSAIATPESAGRIGSLKLMRIDVGGAFTALFGVGVEPTRRGAASATDVIAHTASTATAALQNFLPMAIPFNVEMSFC